MHSILRGDAASPAALRSAPIATNGNVPVHCPHAEECGACAMLGVVSAEQLRRKRAALAAALERGGVRDVEVLPCLASPRTTGYRNRAKMAVGLSRDGRVRLGYFRAGTREIVDAPDCRVLLPELLDTSRRLRGLLRARSDVPRELRHLDLRCGSDPRRQHLTLVLRSATCPTLPLDAIRRSCPAIAGVSVNLNPAGGSQVLRGPIRHLAGEREVRVRVAGLDLRVSPGSFFQVNLAVLPAIHRLMAEFLDEGGTLADLYAGVGTHGLALRAEFGRVAAVEGVRAAVADLRATIRENDLDRVEVVASAVERATRRLRALAPDAVVLNPSRAGARPVVLDALAATAARRVAYLSCEPARLARDLAALRRARFEIVSVRPIDMMPQTAQVEALALLRR